MQLGMSRQSLSRRVSNRYSTRTLQRTVSDGRVCSKASDSGIPCSSFAALCYRPNCLTAFLCSVAVCTCIAGSMSGFIVLITTYLLLHQRKSHAEVTDSHVVETMLISFILSYTLIFTALEPLRAAIKASYVSFAQNPRCLSQSFPLIYHRLCRLSESNVT